MRGEHQVAGASMLASVCSATLSMQPFQCPVRYAVLTTSECNKCARNEFGKEIRMLPERARF